MENASFVGAVDDPRETSERRRIERPASPGCGGDEEGAPLASPAAVEDARHARPGQRLEQGRRPGDVGLAPEEDLDLPAEVVLEGRVDLERPLAPDGRPEFEALGGFQRTLPRLDLGDPGPLFRQLRGRGPRTPLESGGVFRAG